MLSKNQKRRVRQRAKKKAAITANVAPDANTYGAPAAVGMALAPALAVPTRVTLEEYLNSFANSLSLVKGAGASNISDPYQGMYGKRMLGDIIEPPYDPQICSLMQEHSTILRQCVEAKAQNVFGFGWDVKRFDAEEDQENTQADGEYAALTSLFDYINPWDDLTGLLVSVGRDIELTGNGYMEVVPGVATPISEIYRLPSTMTRITAPDDVETPYTELIRGPQGMFIEQPRLRHFRRFVQIESAGSKIWFKEFGDPRHISRETGKPIDGSDDPRELANEVIWHGHPCTYSCYGLPLWVGHWLELIGNRKSDEINVDYFDKKGIPPLAIMISGGKLTREAKRKVRDLIERKIKGSENFHEILILDTMPASTSGIAGESFANVRVDFKPLTNYIQKDANFRKYKDDNILSVMSAFRTPPVIVGRSFDYNKATSIMAARVFENQVAQPERQRAAKRLNRTIFARLQITQWRLYFLGTTIQDTVESVKAMGNVQQALTISEIRDAVAQMRGVPTTDVAEDIPDELLHTPLGLLASLDAEPAGDGEDDEAFKRHLKVWRKTNQIDATTERKLREWKADLEHEINGALKEEALYTALGEVEHV